MTYSLLLEGKSMRILLINHVPLTGSGSGTYTKNLAHYLTSLGNDVCVIFPDNSEPFESIPGVRLHPVFFSPVKSDENISTEARGYSLEDALPFNFPCFTTHPKSTTTFADLNYLQIEQYKTAFLDAIQQEVVLNMPDVVHVQHVWILPCLTIDTGIPIVITSHGTDLMGYDKWPQMRKYAEKAIQASHTVISCSKDNYILLKEHFPDQKDKIVIIRNGYDPRIFYPTNISKSNILENYRIPSKDYEGRQVIIFAGKLTHFKGVDILLDAIKIYEAKNPSTLTLIVGDGEERDILQAQARELELRTVRFLGSVSQENLCKLYNISDVSIVPSRREPFGLVAIEAMACGVPVIATNQGGLPDFVNDNVGALVEVDNANALADAILYILDCEKHIDYKAWRKNIASYARMNYAQDIIIRELESIYLRILS